MTEKETRQLERARKLKTTIHTEGWGVLVAYVLARGNGLKNQLAGTNLTENISKAQQIQGEIKGVNSVINWVTNSIEEVKQLEERKSKEKEKT